MTLATAAYAGIALLTWTRVEALLPDGTLHVNVCDTSPIAERVLLAVRLLRLLDRLDHAAADLSCLFETGREEV